MTVTSDGTRVVRLRQVHPREAQFGPFQLTCWAIADIHGRRNLDGQVFLTRWLAAQYAIRQGWRYIGTQEAP